MRLKSVTKRKYKDTRLFDIRYVKPLKFPFEYEVSIQYDGLGKISYHFSSDKYATIFAERVINTFKAYPWTGPEDAQDVIEDLYIKVIVEQKGYR